MVRHPAPSSSGLGRRPLKAVTAVRICSGLPGPHSEIQECGPPAFSASLARGGVADTFESVYFVGARSAAPVARKGRSLCPRSCALLRVVAGHSVVRCVLRARKRSRASVDSHARVLVVCDRAGHARMRARAFVTRVRHGDALWVREHAVMYMREIHHITFEVG